MEIALTNAHPCPDCRQCLTNADKCRYCAERDQLRAEVERLRGEVQFWETTAKLADKTRDDLHEAWSALNDSHVIKLREVIDAANAAERERDDAQALLNMQHSRVVTATRLWREAHPGNDLVMPDLGRLIDWLLLRSDEARAHAADLRGALREAESFVGRTPKSVESMALYGRIRTALARTPAQSLGRIKAEALREAVEEVRNDEAAQESAATTRGAILCIADRLEVKDGR